MSNNNGTLSERRSRFRKIRLRANHTQQRRLHDCVLDVCGMCAGVTARGQNTSLSVAWWARLWSALGLRALFPIVRWTQAEAGLEAALWIVSSLGSQTVQSLRPTAFTQAGRTLMLMLGG